MLNTFTRMLASKKGATAIEYGLIISLIVVICIISINSLGKGSTGLWNNVEENIVQK